MSIEWLGKWNHCIDPFYSQKTCPSIKFNAIAIKHNDRPGEWVENDWRESDCVAKEFGAFSLKSAINNILQIVAIIKSHELYALIIKAFFCIKRAKCDS